MKQFQNFNLSRLMNCLAVNGTILITFWTEISMCYITALPILVMCFFWFKFHVLLYVLLLNCSNNKIFLCSETLRIQKKMEKEKIHTNYHTLYKLQS